MRSSPTLWQHLDLSGAKRKVRNAFISRAINAARQKLTTATLGMLYDSDKALLAIVKTCPVEDLTLLETGLQSDNLVNILKHAKHLKRLRFDPGTVIGPATLSRILDDASDRLEALEATLAPSCVDSLTKDYLKLRSLSITMAATSTASASMLVKLSSCINYNMRNLQTLRLHTPYIASTPGLRYVLGSLTSLKRLDLRVPLAYVDSIVIPTSLTFLALECTRTLRTASGGFWVPKFGERITHFLPLLEELSLDISGTSPADVVELLDAKPVEVSAVRVFLIVKLANSDALTNGQVVEEDAKTQELSRLRCLHIQAADITPPVLDALLSHPRLQHLQELALRQSEGCDDTCMQIIASRVPCLRRLDVSGTRVSGVGVKEVVSQGHLRHLALNDCRFVGFDAVEWAGSLGVQTEHRKTGMDSGGRKVRH